MRTIPVTHAGERLEDTGMLAECEKIFWEGTHDERMRRIVEEF